MVSLAAQEWINQGRAEGIAEGLAEGRLESVLIILETRFGSIPKYIEDHVRGAEPEQFDSLFRRSLTTPSLQEFFPDEARHCPTV